MIQCVPRSHEVNGSWGDLERVRAAAQRAAVTRLHGPAHRCDKQLVSFSGFGKWKTHTQTQAQRRTEA